MDELDLLVRNETYRRFVELGRPPRLEEIAGATGLTTEEAAASWRRLHEAHALVLERDTPELRMLNPFSCVPSAYRVDAAGRAWYSNCAWDSFAVCAALHSNGSIETSCPDCGAPIQLDVVDRRPVPDEHFFHVLVPAARWWDDIVFT